MSGTWEYCGLIRPNPTMTVVIIVIIVWFRSIFPSFFRFFLLVVLSLAENRNREMERKKLSQSEMIEIGSCCVRLPAFHGERREILPLWVIVCVRVCVCVCVRTTCAGWLKLERSYRYTVGTNNNNNIQKKKKIGDPGISRGKKNPSRKYISDILL
jgi:hypothetical protein